MSATLKRQILAIAVFWMVVIAAYFALGSQSQPDVNDPITTMAWRAPSVAATQDAVCSYWERTKSLPTSKEQLFPEEDIKARTSMSGGTKPMILKRSWYKLISVSRENNSFFVKFAYAANQIELEFECR